MTIDKLLVIFFGILGIGFTAWFFFGKKEEAVEVSGNIDIKVSGGYNPSTIVLKKGKTTTLSFLRTDKNPCLEDIVISDFKIKKNLPLNEKIDVSLKPEKTGEFEISCGMNMFHGKIIVRD